MTKTIILLRHGQYTKEPKEKLTALGRKQARLAGRRLAEFKIDEVAISSMPRAQETASLALKQIHKKNGRLHEQVFCDDLRECVPGFTEELRKKHGYKKTELVRDRKQADRAFKKYFKYSKKESTVLLVCHGNIIRYLTCKALKVPALAWLRLDIKQCGFTILTLDSKKGVMNLITHNETGHIPLKDQTFM